LLRDSCVLEGLMQQIHLSEGCVVKQGEGTNPASTMCMLILNLLATEPAETVAAGAEERAAVCRNDRSGG